MASTYNSIPTKGQFTKSQTKMNRISMARMLYAMYNTGNGDSDLLEGVDIAAEYELIQQKKSDLSASLRQIVIARYERMHKEG